MQIFPIFTPIHPLNLHNISWMDIHYTSMKSVREIFFPSNLQNSFQSIRNLLQTLFKKSENVLTNFPTGGGAPWLIPPTFLIFQINHSLTKGGTKEEKPFQVLPSLTQTKNLKKCSYNSAIPAASLTTHCYRHGTYCQGIMPHPGDQCDGR